MIHLLPLPIRIATLVILGALVGAAINWAIYRLPYFRRRAISPWIRPSDGVSPRRSSDYWPVIGWWGLRRNVEQFGAGFWVRPLLIEIVWMVALPWFYCFQVDGGLVGGLPQAIPPDWATQAEIWFWIHSFLLALLCVATFIDFDERTIPDTITLPGTLLALVIAAVIPAARLPDTPFANMAGKWIVPPIQFASPDPLPGWYTEWIGLVFCLLIVCIWMLALLPKICTLRYGVWRGLKIMLASVVRRRRKSECEIRTRNRGPFGITYLLLGLGVMLAVLLAAGWRWLPEENWTSLFGSVVGLGFGGGMVWSIRLVARMVMGREAMGFGDVTLMAMIGAFLGWQAALLTFAMAPFAALVVVAVTFVITRESMLPFGPYLCFGCLVLLLGWSWIWPAAVMQFFFLGPYLLVVLVVALFMMAVLLGLIQWVKGARE